MWTRSIATLAIVCGLLWFVCPRVWTPHPSEERKPQEGVKLLLEDFRKGGDGRQFWRADMGYKLPVFYAVESYEIVDVDVFGRHMVRILSATKDGAPLMRLYEIMADGNKVWRITAQGDDPHEDVNRMVREAERLGREWDESHRPRH